MNTDTSRLTLREVTADEFEQNLLDIYYQEFPEDERRPWFRIRESWDYGVERFYELKAADDIIGFVMLEKLPDYPYYMDYFAIRKTYQNMGYGGQALKILMETVARDDGIICEIEKADPDNEKTIRRQQFYRRLGFRILDAEYELFEVIYSPALWGVDENLPREAIDLIFTDYLLANNGEERFRENCFILK